MTTPPPPPPTPGPDAVPAVTPATVPDGAYLLDVREPAEWTAGHAAGAQHLPLHDLPARLAEVPTVGDVVVVCRSGGRSATATAYLLAQGWDNVVNLDGGMQAWQAAGRPLVTDSGVPARVL